MQPTGSSVGYIFFVKGSRVSAIPAPSAGQVEGHEVAGSSGVETCLSGDPVYLVLHGVLVDEQSLRNCFYGTVASVVYVYEISNAGYFLFIAVAEDMFYESSFQIGIHRGYYDVEKQMVIHIYAGAAVLFHVYYGLRLLERIGNVFSFGAYGAYGADAAAANPGFFHT